ERLAAVEQRRSAKQLLADPLAVPAAERPFALPEAVREIRERGLRGNRDDDRRSVEERGHRRIMLDPRPAGLSKARALSLPDESERAIHALRSERRRSREPRPRAAA